MALTPHSSHPHHCFCQVDFDLLTACFYKRYVQGISTLTLMELAASKEEKEIVCIVATFDVGEDKLFEMMGDVNLPDHHILHCREAFREKIERLAS